VTAQTSRRASEVVGGSERLAGSLQIGATVRQSWEVVVDPDDKDRRLFLPGKNSNAKSCGGLAFRIVDSNIPMSDDGDFVGRVAWEPGTVDLTANEAAQFESDDETRDPFPVEWLRDYLSTGAKNSNEIAKAAASEGITPKQLRTAKRRLNVKPRKSDFGGCWLCELPEPLSGLPRSLPDDVAAPEAA
jgi:putative DNA primase/helicase